MRLGGLDTGCFVQAETDLDTLSVGLACGFTSASSFSRAFRRQFGQSPRQVREG